MKPGLWQRLRRLWRRPAAAETSIKRATVDDIYACFRLLLRRRPTPEEEAYWRDLVIHHRITIHAMVDEFLASTEFLEKQAAGRQPKLIDLDDFQLYVRPNDFFIGAAIARNRQYEPAVTQIVRSHLHEGDVFVDVGANIGYFTLMAATIVGRNGHVHAVEPNPDNCHLITMSVEANGVENVTLYPFAAAEKTQMLQLDIAGTGSNSRVIDDSPQAVPGSSPPQQVQAVILDKVLAGLERIDLVKMDIEGAEPRALQGMMQILQRHRPILISEFSPALIKVTSHVTPESYLEQLISLHYELSVIGKGKSNASRPLRPREIIDMYPKSGSSHLDLLAYPAEESRQ